MSLNVAVDGFAGKKELCGAKPVMKFSPSISPIFAVAFLIRICHSRFVTTQDVFVAAVGVSSI